MAAVARSAGDSERATTLIGMATTVRGRRDRGDLLGNATEARLRTELGDADFDRLRAAGEAMSRTRVLAELGVESVAGRPGVPLDALAEGAAHTRRR
jgi:hypothetical protein